MSKTATTTLQGYNLPNSFIDCKTSWRDGDIYVEYSDCKTLHTVFINDDWLPDQSFGCSSSSCNIVTNSSCSSSLQIYYLYHLDLSRKAELMIVNELTHKSRGLTSSIISWLPASAQRMLLRQEAFHVLTRCSKGNREKKKKKETHESDGHCRSHKLVGSSAVYLLWVAAASWRAILC